MRILFLTQILPYPPDAGPKFKTWQVIRYLAAQGHQVTLVSLVRADELPHCAYVRQQVAAFYPVPIRRSRLKDGLNWLRSLVTGRPFLVERDDQPDVRTLIKGLLADQAVDAIHADQLTMTQFALPAGDDPHSGARTILIFDAHNATWKILERMAVENRGFKHFFFRLEANRIRRYEARIVTRFDRILAVSQVDRAALLEAVRLTKLPTTGLEHKFEVIPITVDCQEIRPVVRQKGSLNLFTLGTLHYPPNADGIRWFVAEVFPLIRAAVPGVTLTIVGKNPPVDFLHLQQRQPDVFRVPGYVPDLTPWLEQAAVVVVPVRVGGGMRVRILEAFAHAMPVVTTTIGFEGIEAISGEHLLAADGAIPFAQAVITLLGDEDLQNQLAHNGRRLAEKVYDRRIVLKSFDLIYPPESGVPVAKAAFVD